MSTNFAKTLVWKRGNDVKLWRHKQRKPNTNDHHMILTQTPPWKFSAYATVPGYCCQWNVFCDCNRNTGHFLCSIERIKRFLNVHLHCIVSNVHYKVRKYSGPPELLRNEISFSRTCNIPKQWKLHRKQGAIWMKCVFCSYFDKIVYLICNSQSL